MRARLLDLGLPAIGLAGALLTLAGHPVLGCALLAGSSIPAAVIAARRALRPR